MKILILITVTILAVGCGEKNESTADTKPVEEKVVEVKEEVKTEEPLAETKPELEGVNQDELEESEGIYYFKDSDTPYTGKAFKLHSNGQKSWEGNYKGGKEEGLWVWWHENGQKIREGTFKDGKEDGLALQWHENGLKLGKGNYKDGKADGLWILWHENGQKKSEGKFKDGKPDGLGVEWYENGKKRMETNWKEGKLVEGSEKFWNSKGEEVDSLEEAEAE